VRVRIISPPTEASIDGLALSDFKVGSVYALPAELATLMIVEGWADPVDGDAVPVLPAFRFEILPFGPPQIVPHAPRRARRRRFTHQLLAPNAGVAAERRKKRKSPRQR
jgi:hypothetical protein